MLFSPDGKMVVSTNNDKTVTRWDVESATPLETLRGHSNFVQQPVFSPDGETLYTVSHDGTAIAWDLTGDRRLGRPFTFTHDRRFSKTGFDGHPGRLSPDGRLIAVGLKERGVALWDARQLTPVGAPLLDTGGEVKSLDFSPDGKTLAAVTETMLTLWDVGSRSRLHEPLYAGHPSWVLAVGFSPDGATLATASSDLGLRFWDVATGDSLDAPGFDASASDIAFSADGAMIASGSALWSRGGLGCGHTHVDRHVRRHASPTPSHSAPTGTCWRSVATDESYASGTSAPGSSSTSSTRAVTERSPSSSALMAGLSQSPDSSLPRLSGTLRAEPRSARRSPPGTAGR